MGKERRGGGSGKVAIARDVSLGSATNARAKMSSRKVAIARDKSVGSSHRRESKRSRNGGGGGFKNSLVIDDDYIFNDQCFYISISS